MKKLLSLILLLSFNIKAQDVRFGDQVWTSKNLNVSTYRNGDKIPQVQDKKAWVNLKTGAWCYYENKAENGTKYGKLYNWYAVNDKRGLAPKGYHIPSDAEWTKLTDYLGGEYIAPAKMKSTYGWYEDGNGINESGFEALPGGGRAEKLGHFYNIGAFGYWWSSSDCIYGFAWFRNLSFNKRDGIISNFKFKEAGISVRCIKN